MRRMLLVMATVVLMVLGSASAAFAQNQPGEGENSTGRNDAGFGGGPHCHVLAVDNAGGNFEFIRVFPSHRGHEASGLPDRVFVADADCDGLPGVTEPDPE